ncbi:MAG: HTH domain-containing protein [Bacteroidales bacterium]|nr:HTH domain-containing protein [Bacteroidales bacterium]
MSLQNRPTSPPNVIEKVGDNVGEKTAKTLKGKAKREEDIISLMRSSPTISFAELALALNVAERTIARDIARLRKENKIKRQGGDKGGEWVIL